MFRCWLFNNRNKRNGYYYIIYNAVDDLLGSKFISVGPETMEAFDTQFTDYVQKLANIKAAKAPKMPGK